MTGSIRTDRFVSNRVRALQKIFKPYKYDIRHLSVSSKNIDIVLLLNRGKSRASDLGKVSWRPHVDKTIDRSLITVAYAPKSRNEMDDCILRYYFNRHDKDRGVNWVAHVHNHSMDQRVNWVAYVHNHSKDHGYDNNRYHDGLPNWWGSSGLHMNEKQ